jgi:hypothetical protein
MIVIARPVRDLPVCDLDYVLAERLRLLWENTHNHLLN